MEDFEQPFSQMNLQEAGLKSIRKHRRELYKEAYVLVLIDGRTHPVSTSNYQVGLSITNII
jgi:hypothetical protein